MADNRPEVRRPVEQPAERAARLAPAGESGDPEVHRLLAERQGHEQNAEEPPDRKAVREAALEAIKAIDAKLAKLGYTAK